MGSVQSSEWAGPERPDPGRPGRGPIFVVFTWESEENFYVLSLRHETIRAKITIAIVVEHSVHRYHSVNRQGWVWRKNMLFLWSKKTLEK